MLLKLQNVFFTGSKVARLLHCQYMPVHVDHPSSPGLVPYILPVRENTLLEQGIVGAWGEPTGYLDVVIEGPEVTVMMGLWFSSQVLAVSFLKYPSVMEWVLNNLFRVCNLVFRYFHFFHGIH